jgi:hypothetical protein
MITFSIKIFNNIKEMNVYILITIILILILILICYKQENFFVKFQNAEFRGINMLGLNSDSTSIPVKSPNECEQICNRNKSCLGFTFYYPGQKCYLFNTKGGFVPERPGYISGMRIN